jgi:bla regulator protein BlaR1
MTGCRIFERSIRRPVLVLVAGWMGLVCSALLAQVGGTTQTPVPLEDSTKTLAFDVVSIRPTKPGDDVGNTAWGIQPAGYRARGQSLWSTIMVAYFPDAMVIPAKTGKIKDPVLGAPSWTKTEYFDIDAKVAPEDMAVWRGQGRQKEMLRAMLRTMLTDRCKLVVHRVPAEVGGYTLVTEKRGPQLQAAKPDVPSTPGMETPDGGKILFTGNGRQNVEWSFYNVSMPSLVSWLSLSVGSMVQDGTGLTGKYDFVMRDQGDTGATGEDAPPADQIWNLDALGLMLKPIKIPIETVAIDHIERSSEN